jgi:septum site-determining protein MinD
VAEVLSIVSGKGGVGKTTTTANLGTALAAMGYKVLLIDGDAGLRNLDIALGMQEQVVYHFLDIMEHHCPPENAVITDEKHGGLRFLSAPQDVSGAEIDKARFKQMVDGFRPYYDYIMIDCAAGIDDGFAMAAGAADRAIIVATPELISARDADRVAARLEAYGVTEVFLLINRIRVDMIKKGDMIDIDTIINIVAVPLIGAVPEDAGVITSNITGTPVVLQPKTRAGKAYLNIAKRVTGRKVPIAREEKRGFGRLFRRK